jgi:hypothetical protein
MRMTKRKDLSGKKFGKFTVLTYDDTKTDRVYYRCLCDCGNERVVLAQNLKNGKSRSCGCLKVANITSRKRTNPILVTARKVWLNNYADGCSFDTFFKLAQQPCYYCGAAPSNHARAYTGNHPVIKRSPDWAEECQWTYSGLDRLDSNKNHSEDNIVPCCIICNRAKHALSLEEFKAWANRLYTHFVVNK